MNGGTLIVGASQAGAQLAVSLRESGDEEPIALIGAESYPPYQRPPLSKAFLAERVDVASLAFRTSAFYQQKRIEVVCGERVERLHMSSAGPPGSGIATTDGGRTLAFDRLALTVGARPRRLDVPGSDLEGVVYLRDINDAIRLRTRLRSARDIVVIGGGFIGLEAAAVACAPGRAVTVVEAADRLLSRSVAPVVSEFYRRAHLRRGTAVHLGAAVAAIVGERGRVDGVELSDGSHLSADLVIVGVGIVPRTELAEQIGLTCDGGIVVDQFARTSTPSVVAAGDCTVLPDPRTGKGRVRLESVQNAVSQARVAAATLVGRSEPHAVVPWFWSDQYDLKLQIAGLTTGYDHCVIRGDPESEKFSVLYYRGESLLAIGAVNHAADYMTVLRALAQGATIDAGKAGDSDTPLKGLVVPG